MFVSSSSDDVAGLVALVVIGEAMRESVSHIAELFFCVTASVCALVGIDAVSFIRTYVCMSSYAVRLNGCHQSRVQPVRPTQCSLVDPIKADAWHVASSLQTTHVNVGLWFGVCGSVAVAVRKFPRNSSRQLAIR